MDEEMPADTLLTKDTVDIYVDLCGDEIQLFGYMDAIDHYDPELRELVEKAKDFDDLKSQLLAFCDKQVAFRNFVYEKFDP